MPIPAIMVALQTLGPAASGGGAAGGAGGLLGPVLQMLKGDVSGVIGQSDAPVTGGLLGRVDGAGAPAPSQEDIEAQAKAAREKEFFDSLDSLVNLDFRPQPNPRTWWGR